MKELSVDEARDWYNNFNKNSRTNKEGNTPIWGDAVQRKVSDNESIVVVPLLIVNNLSFSINDNQRMKSENDYISSDIKTNLVFMKTENKIEQLEMRIISSDAYSLKRTKLESKDFDGYVYFFDSNQKFHSGLVYENGRITGTMRNSIKSGKTQSYIQICIDWYQNTCINGGTDCTGWIFQRSDCSTVYVSEGGSASVSVFTTSLEAAVSGGTGSSLNAMLELPGGFDLWNNMNQTERDYFTAKWWLIPSAIKSNKYANDMVEHYYCNNSDDGNWNAFKHSFWAATLSLLVGPRTALEITGNHEIDSPQMRKTMDLYNNDMGINVFKNLSSQLNSVQDEATKISMLINSIFSKINGGYGKRLVPENVNTTQSLLNTNSYDRCL